MGRAVRLALLLAALVGVALVFAPRGVRGTAILGDGAPGLRAALGDAPVPAGVVTTLDVALLRRPSNIRHLPDARALCRDACDAAMTVIVEPRPGGWRKLAVVQLDAFTAAEALDRGEDLPPDLAACLARAVAAEAAALRAEAPGCVPNRRAVWRLPFGL